MIRRGSGRKIFPLGNFKNISRKVGEEVVEHRTRNGRIISDLNLATGVV
jgi:hypothetical protein